MVHLSPQIKDFLSPRGQFVRNLELEHFLDEGVLTELVDRIEQHRARGGSLGEFEVVYGKFVPPHRLAGGDVHSGSRPRIVGRIVEQRKFAAWLLGHPRMKGVYYEVEELVQDLRKAFQSDGRERTRFRETVGDAPDPPMSEFNAWVTWENTDSTHEPVDLGLSKEEICAMLALDDRVLTKDLFLLVYELPPVVELFRPTICDTFMNWGFEPPPPEFTDHGLTKPRENGRIRPERAAEVLQRRPEAIHRPMSLVHLRFGPDAPCCRELS